MTTLDDLPVAARVRRMVAAELARWQQLAAWLDADADAAHTPGDAMTPHDAPTRVLDRLDAAEAHLAALEVHQRAQFANLHARADTLRGAILLQSDRQSDFAASLAQLRAELRREPCSLCVRGDGCDSCLALHGAA